MYFFFFNDTATTEIYTLSLHDALPILLKLERLTESVPQAGLTTGALSITNSGSHGGKLMTDVNGSEVDRKSTRLNSSHANISYAVFCLKKKKNKNNDCNNQSNQLHKCI